MEKINVTNYLYITEKMMQTGFMNNIVIPMMSINFLSSIQISETHSKMIFIIKERIKEIEIVAEIDQANEMIEKYQTWLRYQ
jgi:hypothetical protein